jgi:hypothetical protein
LLTNLKEHITNDPRLEKIVEKASSLLEYFDQFLGRIEIMGSSKRVEKIYFEIQESWLEQVGFNFYTECKQLLQQFGDLYLCYSGANSRFVTQRMLSCLMSCKMTEGTRENWRHSSTSAKTPFLRWEIIG